MLAEGSAGCCFPPESLQFVQDFSVKISQSALLIRVGVTELQSSSSLGFDVGTCTKSNSSVLSPNSAVVDLSLACLIKSLLQDLFKFMEWLYSTQFKLFSFLFIYFKKKPFFGSFWTLYVNADLRRFVKMSL